MAAKRKPFVDQVEDGHATVLDDQNAYAVPTSQIPKGAKEGDELGANGAATPAVDQATEDKRSAMGANDPGGTISLDDSPKANPLIDKVLQKIRDPKTTGETRWALISHPQVQGYVDAIRKKTVGGETMSDDDLLGAGPMHLYQQKKDAETAAAEAARKNRLDALDAGEADIQFEAKATGQAENPPGLSGHFLQAMGVPPEDRAMIALRANPKYMAQRAELGDQGAGLMKTNTDAGATAANFSTSTALGGILGPAGSVPGALAKGYLAAAGGAGTEEAMKGGSLKDVATKADQAGESGAVLNLLIHGVGAIGKNRVDTLRSDPDVGPDLNTAEAGGRFKTKFGRGGIEPTTPHPPGQLPGPGGVAQKADKIAPEFIKRTDAMDGYLTRMREAADTVFHAASRDAGQTADSTPIIKAFRESIRHGTFDDAAGTHMPEAMVDRLANDMRAFATVTEVPAEEAEGIRKALSKPGRVVGGVEAEGATIEKMGDRAFLVRPRQLNSRELEDVRQKFDLAGSAGDTPSAQKAPFRRASEAAKGMREEFPGLDDMKNSQSKKLTELDSYKSALGISESKRLDEDAAAQVIRVGNALKNYKVPTNVRNNAVLDDFIKKHPDLRPDVEELASMSAAERLRTGPAASEGTSTSPTSKQGISRTLWNMRPGRSLHLDPVMRAMAKAKGGAPAAAGASGATLGPEVTKFLWDAILKQQDQGSAP